MSSYSSFEEDDDNDGVYSDEEEEEGEGGEGNIRLVPCGNCGRNFNEESLSRHENICKKVKQRKPFDSKKQRLLGVVDPTKIKSATNKTGSASSQRQIQPKKKDWRAAHKEFIKTIRAARGVNEALKNGEELPPPPAPTINPDYVQCPVCERRFNETAAERHINFCREQKSRLPKQPSDMKYGDKKEKQDKRRQYKPPLPGSKKKNSDTTTPVKRASSSSMSPASRTPSTSSAKKQEKKTNGSPIDDRRGSSKDNGKTPHPPPANDYEERPVNSRYSKSSTYRTDPSETEHKTQNKSKSAKERIGDPKWLEDMKRQDSGRSKRKEQQQDLDINDNYPPAGGGGSRHKTKHVVEHEERSGVQSLGRRGKMANFCHDCGTKYPVVTAKFCCECGIQRMSLT